MTNSQSKIKYRKMPPDDIIVLAISALNSEITENMRAIAFGYDGKNAKFLFYMANKPKDFEKEAAEVIATTFDSGHPTKMESLDIEFVVTREKIGKLDGLNFILFHRHELEGEWMI